MLCYMFRIPHCLITYGMLYVSYSAPAHTIYHALCTQFHTISFHMTCCKFPVLHYLIPYVMLYIPYSTPPYPICYAVRTLFNTYPFCMPCCKFPIPYQLILYAKLYVPFSTPFLMQSCTFPIPLFHPTPPHSLCKVVHSLFHTASFHMLCCMFPIPKYLNPYAMLYVPYFTPPHSICHALPFLFRYGTLILLCFSFSTLPHSIHLVYRMYVSFTTLHYSVYCAVPILHQTYRLSSSSVFVSVLVWQNWDVKCLARVQFQRLQWALFTIDVPLIRGAWV